MVADKHRLWRSIELGWYPAENMLLGFAVPSQVGHWAARRLTTVVQCGRWRTSWLTSSGEHKLPHRCRHRGAERHPLANAQSPHIAVSPSTSCWASTKAPRLWLKHMQINLQRPITSCCCLLLSLAPPSTKAPKPGLEAHAEVTHISADQCMQNAECKMQNADRCPMPYDTI